VRHIARYLPLCFLALGSMHFAAAQTAFDLNMGFGSFHDSSTGSGIDSQTFATCTTSTDTTCQNTPALSGFFLGFGGDLMLHKSYGVGAEIAFTPARTNYGPLSYRETFFDFDGIYSPIHEKKVGVQISGGIGDAKTGFTYTQTGCVGTAVCSTQNSPVGSSNHFQIHAGVGVQIFLNDHWFVKPQFDFHYVPGLTNQFGSDAVIGGMVWVGYSWGDR